MIEKRMAVSVDHAMEFLAPVPEFHNHKDFPQADRFNVEMFRSQPTTHKPTTHTRIHLLICPRLSIRLRALTHGRSDTAPEE